MLGRELRYFRDEIGDRVEVGRRAPPNTLQERRAQQLAEHRARVGGGNRRDSQRSVLENLHQHAAQPHYHERAEAIVARYPGNQFEPPRRHRLHRNPVEARTGTLGGQALPDAFERGLDLGGRAQAKLDAADFTLVDRLRRKHFEYGREAHARGEFHGFLGALGEIGSRDRNSDRLEDLLGFDFREFGAAGSDSLREHPVDG